jgi:hypothetical protein
MDKESASGGVAFYAMVIIVAFMLIACVACPLLIPGFSKQEYALPLMGTAMALPFVHFFIFGGIAIAQSKK